MCDFHVLWQMPWPVWKVSYDNVESGTKSYIYSFACCEGHVTRKLGKRGSIKKSSNAIVVTSSCTAVGLELIVCPATSIESVLSSSWPVLCKA